MDKPAGFQANSYNGGFYKVYNEPHPHPIRYWRTIYNSLNTAKNAAGYRVTSVSPSISKDYSFTYDVQGRIESVKYYAWDNTTQQWVFTSDRKIAYNAKDEITADTTYSNTGSVASYYVWDYNTGGNLVKISIGVPYTSPSPGSVITEELAFSYNPDNTVKYAQYNALDWTWTTMMPQSRHEYLYTSGVDFYTTKIKTSYHPTNGWIYPETEIKHLNAQNLPDTLWGVNKFKAFTYDANGNISSQIVYDSARLQTPWDEYHYYYENYDNSNVAGINSESGIKLYPNPAEQLVKIALGNDLPAILEVMDMSGKCLMRRYANNPEVQIDIIDFASGMYILKVTNDKGNSICLQFVKQ